MQPTAWHPVSEVKHPEPDKTMRLPAKTLRF